MAEHKLEEGMPIASAPSGPSYQSLGEVKAYGVPSEPKATGDTTASTISENPYYEKLLNTQGSGADDADGTGDPREILSNFEVRNFPLLLAGFFAGMGCGVVLWIFFDKLELVWGMGGAGIVGARALQRFFPPKRLLVYATCLAENTDIFAPPDTEGKIPDNVDFFVQSDLEDFRYGDYLRSTLVYHFRGSNALVVREKMVERVRPATKLKLDGPIGLVVGAICAAICTVAQLFAMNGECNSKHTYCKKGSLHRPASVSIVMFVVLTAAFFCIVCVVETELRKRGFFQYHWVWDVRRAIALHTIGDVSVELYGANMWRFFVPEDVVTRWRIAVATWNTLCLPLVCVWEFFCWILYCFAANGALGIWILLNACIGTLIYAHVWKDEDYVIPSAAVAWVLVVINAFQVWYSSPGIPMQRMCGCTKMEFQRHRIPRRRLKFVFAAFLVSLVLLFVSAVFLSVVVSQTHGHSNSSGNGGSSKRIRYITCQLSDKKGNAYQVNTDATEPTASSLSRADYDKYVEEATDGDIFANTDFDFNFVFNDYEDLCKDKNYIPMAMALSFLMIDWVLMLITMVLWYLWDERKKIHNYNILWHHYVKLGLKRNLSRVNWLGYLLGTWLDMGLFFGFGTRTFFMREEDAAKVQEFIVSTAPWYAEHSANPNLGPGRQIAPQPYNQ